jgi:hypothetical protein
MLAASSDDPAKVTLRWAQAPPSPHHWQVLANGLLVAQIPAALGAATFDDETAPAGVVGTLGQAQASADLGDRVRVSWPAVSGAPGAPVTYRVVAQTGAQSAASGSAAGRRAVPEVRYTIEVNTSLFDLGDAGFYDDFTAPAAVIDGDAGAVVDATRGVVLLGLVGWRASPPTLREYVVHATAVPGGDAGVSHVFGQRALGSVATVQWLRQSSSAAPELLPEVTGPWWLDEDAPFDTPLTYWARVSVDGGQTVDLPVPNSYQVSKVIDFSLSPTSWPCAALSNGEVVTWNNAKLFNLKPPAGRRIAKVACRNNICGLLDNGEARCLGVGPVGGTYTSLSSSFLGTCGLRSSGGTPECWNGDDGGRWLMIAGADRVPFVFPDGGPVEPPPISLTSLSGSASGFCGTSDAGAVCFGQEFGTGELTPPQGTFIFATAGTPTSVGVLADGGLAAWGTWSDGSMAGPPLLPPGPWAKAAAWQSTICGVHFDGGVVCGARPQPNGAMYATAEVNGIGQGVSEVVVAPAMPAGVPLVGWDKACANAEGRVRCWGYADSDNRSRPPRERFTSLGVATFAGCGIEADGGTVRCWGSNTRHHLWNEDRTLAPPPASQAPYSKLSVAHRVACAIDRDSQVRCWGDLAPPSTFFGGGLYRDVATGDGTVCATAVTGALRCTPGFDGGALPQDPQKVSLASVDGGAPLGCALDHAGAITCFGAAPPGAPASGSFSDVACAPAHCCAVEATAGGVVCWGLSSAIGTTPSGGGFVRVAVSGSGISPNPTPLYGLSCALSAKGEVTCFGSYAQSWVPFGLLGNTTTPPPGRYLDLAVGFTGSCLLRDDGHAVCFGTSDFGQAPNLFARPQIDLDL